MDERPVNIMHQKAKNNAVKWLGDKQRKAFLYDDIESHAKKEFR